MRGCRRPARRSCAGKGRSKTWLTNLDLRDFGPYCEHYTAYPLTKGNLTFRSQNVIRDRYLDGTNHLDMFEPKVDKKRREIKA